MNQKDVNQILGELCAEVASVFPGEKIDPVLFGSYARGEADEGSDIDVLLLVDTPREQIARRHRHIGNIAAELLLKHDVLVSPIVENRSYFLSNVDLLPFYRNIQKEGVTPDV